MTTPFRCRARRSASADLPPAVGPVIRIASKFSSRFFIMAFVATLIANPSNPVLTPALGEAAAKAVNASGLYWLADGIACDIALP
ncbi:phosphoserine phosphatase SerB, partial [Rhizobium sp. BR5]